MNQPEARREILVPLDGSAFAERALAPASRLAAGTGDRVRLLRVPEIYGIDMAWYAEAAAPGAVAAEPIRELMAEARDEAAAYLATAAGRLNGEGVETVCTLDEREPADAILSVAESHDAWLIVMATHGHGGVTRWAFGSVADEILHRADRPVLLVRSGAADRPLDHVMVPLDGSDRAEAILPDVRRVAAALGARVSLVTVVVEPIPGNIPPRFLEARKDYAQRMQDYLDGWVARLQGDGLEARSSVISAVSPAEALLDWEQSRSVGLVAMTTHGRTGLARAAFGSVADRLIREGSAPALVRRVA